MSRAASGIPSDASRSFVLQSGGRRWLTPGYGLRSLRDRWPTPKASQRIHSAVPPGDDLRSLRDQ